MLDNSNPRLRLKDGAPYPSPQVTLLPVLRTETATSLHSIPLAMTREGDRSGRPYDRFLTPRLLISSFLIILPDPSLGRDI